MRIGCSDFPEALPSLLVNVKKTQNVWSLDNSNFIVLYLFDPQKYLKRLTKT